MLRLAAPAVNVLESPSELLSQATRNEQNVVNASSVRIETIILILGGVLQRLLEGRPVGGRECNA
jgi:hypothetical protein